MKDLLDGAGDGTLIPRTRADIIEGTLRTVMEAAWCAQKRAEGGKKPDDTLLTIRMATEIRDVVAAFADTQQTRDAIGDMIASSRALKETGPNGMLCDELVHLMAYLPKKPNGKTMGESFTAYDRLWNGWKQPHEKKIAAVLGPRFLPRAGVQELAA